MTIHHAYQQLLLQLKEFYDEPEAANIGDWVIEHVTGKRKIDRITNKNLPVSHEQSVLLNTITGQLLQHKPVQYVLGEAWFAGMKLFVDENVLIPRPETEELAEWINSDVGDLKFKVGSCKIIDVGTGSGCIAIALKKNIPNAEIHAIDVSKGALEIAKRNAKEQETEIDFLEIDFLDEEAWQQLGTFDIIVSNPPYIKKSEEIKMNDNVLKYEPHTALFVPDDDALIFYRALAEFATTHLDQRGSLYVEINEELGNEVARLFKQHGYTNVEVRKDMQGKDRMIKASRI